MIGFLPGTTPASLYDEFKTLASPYATFFSGGKFAPRSEAMDQNLQSIVRDQIATTGKGSGIIGYSDFDKSQTPGTEFPNADTLLSNMIKGKISPAEFANATTLGRLTYDVDPNTGKVNFGSNVYDFRPEVADQGGVFGVFAKMANETGREINPNITVPVDELRGFARDFSLFDQARMGQTLNQGIAKEGIAKEDDLMDYDEFYEMPPEKKKGILEAILSKGKDIVGNISDKMPNFGITGMLSKLDNFKNLSPLDRQFILEQAGGNRPGKDRYGYNIRSAFGNYANLVGKKSLNALTKSKFGIPLTAMDKYYIDKEKARAAKDRAVLDAAFASGQGGSGQNFTGGRYDGAPDAATYSAEPTAFSGSS
tara:strand:- start:30 stop:1130 length:1101 start_codon:yes stop_codon:yes gene_type:complete